MKTLLRILWGLVYALPAVLFFSYYPVIMLGSDNSMNFELSLPLIWLVLFDVVAFVVMILLFRVQKWKHLPGISDKRFFLFAIFPLYVTASIFWSANPVRGFLTSGVIWLVFFAVFAILYILPLTGPSPKFKDIILKIFLVSSVLVCIFCLVQSVLDILGVPREQTLLCRGCTYRSFGFPHPSGFAIEPQFMGNLLLAPTLTALYLIAFGRHKVKRQRILLTLGAGFLSLMLFFTFSRGAIYAYAVALIILLAFAWKRKWFKWSLIGVPVASFVLSLGMQGIFAAVGPTSETFISAITKSIHQLSLGIVDLRAISDNVIEVDQETSLQPVENFYKTVDNYEETCGKLVENSAENVQNSMVSVEKTIKYVDNYEKNVEKLAVTCAKPVQKEEITVEKAVYKLVDSSVENVIAEVDFVENINTIEESGETPVFDGYVAESTNIRLSLNGTAVQTWLNAPNRLPWQFGTDCDQPYSELCTKLTPGSILFGVGIGGAGTAMHRRFPEIVTSPKEIVQNQIFSLLLETGLIGVCLVIFALAIAFFPQIFPAKFTDGKAATNKSPNTFWRHPALPLLCALIMAYIITLNFFSGLPNALQIYLMPPLLYLIFQNPAQLKPKTEKLSVNAAKNKQKVEISLKNS